MPTIKSKNFTLRPYKKSDEKSLVLNIKNKIIDRNTSNIPHPYTLKEARKWIIRCQKQAKMKKPKQVTFTIDINGEASGGISLSKIDYRHNQAELGYWLGEKYWGKGIMTNACKLVTQYGLNKLKLVRIYAFVFPWNKASMKVLEKCGYKFEGILKKDIKKGKTYIDDHLYAKVRG